MHLIFVFSRELVFWFGVLLFLSNIIEYLSRRDSLQFQLIAQTVVYFNSCYELERVPENPTILHTSGVRTFTMDSFAGAKHVFGMTRPQSWFRELS